MKAHNLPTVVLFGSDNMCGCEILFLGWMPDKFGLHYFAFHFIFEKQKKRFYLEDKKT